MTVMESGCYHVHGKGEARVVHLAIGNRAFPKEGVGGSRACLPGFFILENSEMLHEAAFSELQSFPGSQSPKKIFAAQN